MSLGNCKDCHGYGYTVTEPDHPDGYRFLDCPTCEGTGEFPPSEPEPEKPRRVLP